MMVKFNLLFCVMAHCPWEDPLIKLYSFNSVCRIVVVGGGADGTAGWIDVRIPDCVSLMALHWAPSACNSCLWLPVAAACLANAARTGSAGSILRLASSYYQRGPKACTKTEPKCRDGRKSFNKLRSQSMQGLLCIGKTVHKLPRCYNLSKL